MKAGEWSEQAWKPRPFHSSLQHVKDIERLNDFQPFQTWELKVNTVLEMLCASFEGLCEILPKGGLWVTERLLLTNAPDWLWASRTL